MSQCETENPRLDACLDQLQAESNGLSDSLLHRDAVIAYHTATITAFASAISEIHSEKAQLRHQSYHSGYHPESVSSPTSDFLIKLHTDKSQTSLCGAHRALLAMATATEVPPQRSLGGECATTPGFKTLFGLTGGVSYSGM